MKRWYDRRLAAAIPVFAAAAVLWVGGLYASQSEAAPEEVVYKTVGSAKLRLFIFEPNDTSRAKPSSAIVFFFGGGWTHGEPNQFFPQCRYFASRGMVAVSAEYRVKSRNGTGPVECVKDGKSTIRWVRAHAGKLGIDPNKIAAGGGSAGGHVAACTALIEGFDEKNEDASVSSAPNALVLFNPALNLDGPRVKAHLLKTFPQFDGDITRISPSQHVRPNLPPTIIFHGTNDRIVPIENVGRFCVSMKKAGNKCKLVAFKGKGHGFFNFGREKDNKPFKETLKEADNFLCSLGFLQD